MLPWQDSDLPPQRPPHYWRYIIGAMLTGALVIGFFVYLNYHSASTGRVPPTVMGKQAPAPAASCGYQTYPACPGYTTEPPQPGYPAPSPEPSYPACPPPDYTTTCPSPGYPSQQPEPNPSSPFVDIGQAPPRSGYTIPGEIPPDQPGMPIPEIVHLVEQYREEYYRTNDIGWLNEYYAVRTVAYDQDQVNAAQCEGVRPEANDYTIINYNRISQWRFTATLRVNGCPGEFVHHYVFMDGRWRVGDISN